MSTVKKVRIDDTVTEIRPAVREKRQRRPEVLRCLIPPETIDEAFQRIFLVSVFVLIQSWKIYDLILINSVDAGSSSTVTSLGKVALLVKYAVVEGLYLWILPILNVSYLSFSPLVTLLFTLLLNLFNIVLASQLNLMLVVAVMTPLLQSLSGDKELTVGGDAINPHAIDMNSHFKGTYTIQYLPDSLAKFNVFGLSGICQDVEDRSLFNIPIEFNTTTDIGLLEIEYTSPENKLSKLTYHESDILSFMSKDYTHLKGHKKYVSDDYRVFYIEVPVSDPGTYKLSKVKDKKGISMRYVQNSVSFGFCPDASFLIPRSVKNEHQKLCAGSKLDNISTMLPLMTYFGAPPLTVKISASVNGKFIKNINTVVSLEALDTTKYNLTHVYAHKITRNSIEQEILKDPSLLTVKDSSKIEFQISEVTDSLGNTKRYNPQSTSSEVRYSFDVLTRPSIRLIEMDSSEKLLVNGTKGISFATTKNIREQLPLVAEFEYSNGDEVSKFSHTFKTFDDLKKGVSITNPGSYKLLSVQGKYCDCQVQSSVLEITQVEPPSVIVSDEPMIDKCVGMTGYSFNFDATGEPPFVVEYSVFLNSSSGLRVLPSPNGMPTRKIKGNTNNFSFDYKPPGEGNYVIKLEAIKDANYYQTPTYLLEEKHTYLTYFKLRSKVSFFDGESSKTRTIYTCQGQSSEIPVYFKGNFPFTFNYAIVNRDTKKNIIEKKNQIADSNKFIISTSDIKLGGTYDIIISNIVDHNSCSADHDRSEKITLVTRSDTPEVTFAMKEVSSSYEIVEGDSIEIPIQVKSSVGRTNGDVIEYEREFEGKKTTGKIVGTQNLRISKPGTYKLTSFSNGKCGGLVSDAKVIDVKYFPRPKISVEAPSTIQTSGSNIVLKPGCQSCSRKATFKFEGSAPFIIDYEIRLPNGRSELRTMTSEKHQMVADLPTDKSGQYQHVFKAIFDKHYTKSKSPDTNAQHPVISYQVFQSPDVVFTGGETAKLCEASLSNNIIDLSAIPIKLQGKPPFSVNLTLEGEGLKKSLYMPHIENPELNLNEAVDGSGIPIWHSLKQGEYEVHFSGISDANGCVNSVFDQFNAFVFSVTPAPDVVKYDSHQHYCVGQHVGYDLTGQPPFTLTYNFNGKQHKAKTSSEFRRLAAKPGEISVSSLEDSSAGHCIINIQENSDKFTGLTIKIHDLPSVEINQGDSIIQDIHEGDMTEMKFTFTGTPPFTVIYTRTLEPNTKAKRSKSSKRQNGKIVETETIKDIMDHEYTVKVGLEGTYEAIEIRDKYCRAKKEM